MRRAKQLSYYNGRLKGALTDDECEKLENIISLDAENGCFSDLKHIIYEVPDSVLIRYIEDMEGLGYSTDGVNLKSYVGELRDDQTLGTAFMMIAKNCILGDSVGLGKTAQVAGLCNFLREKVSDIEVANGTRKLPFKFLMLTEKNLIMQTRREMIKFTGEYVHALSSLEKPCSKFLERYPLGAGLKHSIVGGHSLLNQGLFLEWLHSSATIGQGAPFELLIIDESSVVSNPKADIYKNLQSIQKYFKRIVFLNATPFESKLSIFFSQLDLLDSSMLPVKTNLQKEYVVMDYRGMYPRPTNKYKNQAQFRELVKYRYFARTRKSKGAVMEDSTGRVITSPLSNIQKELLSKTMMPQLVRDCPSYFDPSIPFDEDTVPKLQSLKEALTKDCADADSILIFVRYKEAQERLSDWLDDMGYSNRRLYGDTKAKEREEIIRGFKNLEFRVLITNVQKGLNFGNCNHCIFFAFDPNPNKMVQFEGRITRSFDITNKHIIILCSEGEELRQLNTVVRQRAQASSDFTTSDISCIMDLLLYNKEE